MKEVACLLGEVPMLAASKSLWVDSKLRLWDDKATYQERLRYTLGTHVLVAPVAPIARRRPGRKVLFHLFYSRSVT
jgi:hypothetical protein